MSTDAEIRALHESVDVIDRISDQEWATTLNERKRRELEFHDLDRDPARRAEAAAASDTYEKFYGNKKYYAATRRSTTYIHDWIVREAAGRVFLDYACGNGINARLAAASGAKLSMGLDISPVSIENARRAAEDEGVAENCRFFQADAENTKLPDNSVDVLICSGMLHHLDLSFAFPELRRILKPGGKLLAVEALDYNPAIKLYRRMTPAMRTDWEKAHILRLRDVKFGSRFFDVKNVRYWHICGYIGGKFPGVLPAVDRLDVLLERIPYLQRLAWMFSFELHKPEDPLT
jgi:SAM-dependent methyltransferase